MAGNITVVSAEDFLREFVPPAASPPPPKLGRLFNEIGDCTGERDMYLVLTSVLNKDTDLCPGFTIVTTFSEADGSETTGETTDCGMYSAERAPKTIGKTGEAISATTDWSSMEVSIRCKAHLGEDPFNDDNEHNSLEHTDHQQKTLYQIILHLQHVLVRQQRTFYFMILFIRDHARIVRVDRSALFVTSRFRYKSNPQPLIEFLWRFSRLSSEQRGFDPTAERIAPSSVYGSLIRARVLLGTKDYVRDYFEESLDEYWPWWLLRVPDEETGKERRFLVGRPHAGSAGVVGRGMRGYIALDADQPTGPLFFLKDTWRVVRDDLRKEGETLKYLNNKKVPHIPTLECHGDLEQTATSVQQVTRSQDLWHKYHPHVPPGAPCPLRKHVHYRLVVKEVGQDLTNFATGYELLNALFYCLRAHAFAYKFGVIHRDLSAGNMLLYPDEDGRLNGMLTDWELSKDSHSDSETPTGPQSDRTGTWQFLSAQALLDPDKDIVIPDELESMFHVLLYMAVRFLPHNYEKEFVGELLYNYFDGYMKTKEGYRCGSTKLHAMYNGEITFVKQKQTVQLEFLWEEDSDAPHPLDGVIYELFQWFKAYYNVHYPKPVQALGKVTCGSTRQAPETWTRKVVLGPPAESWGLGDDENTFHNGTTQDTQSTGVSADGRREASPPSAEDSGLAAKLRNHIAMAKLFQEWLDISKHPWPLEDKGGDKRPKGGYRPYGEDFRFLSSYRSESGCHTQSLGKRPAEDLDDCDIRPRALKRTRSDAA